jgi:hypothetical protein
MPIYGTVVKSEDTRHREFSSVLVIVAWLVISYGLFLVLPNSLLIELMQEDGIFETSGTLCFLAAAILAFVLFFGTESGNDFYFFKTGRNLFYFILGLLFLFAFGEEISWGQRLFGLRTPQVLEAVNTQGEINLHNLAVFRVVSTNRLFSLFWFAYCVFLPLAYSTSRHFAKVVKRINIPVLPVRIGLLFLGNYLISRVVNISVSVGVHNSLIEFKEFNFGLLFLVAMFSFTFVFRKRRKYPGMSV